MKKALLILVAALLGMGTMLAQSAKITSGIAHKNIPANAAKDVTCNWVSNILTDDEPGVVFGAMPQYQIYSYAERFTNSGTVTIDSIAFYSYRAATSPVTFTVYGETAGEPGATLGTFTVPANQTAANDIVSVAVANPITVTGNYYIAFTCGTSDANFGVVATTPRNAPNNNTAYVQYSGDWYTIDDVFTITDADENVLEGGLSFYIMAYTCEGTGGGEEEGYTITVNANPANGGTVTGGGYYAEGATATLTATANQGWAFSGWADGVTDNPRTVTVTENATYTANFVQAASYTITVTKAEAAACNDFMGATVTGGGTYAEGTQVTLTATPGQGDVFVRWNDNSTDATRVITVTANATYTAYFKAGGSQGIDEVEAEVLRVEYFDVMGRQLAEEPAQGLYLIRTVTAQGASVRKVVRK